MVQVRVSLQVSWVLTEHVLAPSAMSCSTRVAFSVPTQLLSTTQSANVSISVVSCRYTIKKLHAVCVRVVMESLLRRSAASAPSVPSSRMDTAYSALTGNN